MQEWFLRIGEQTMRATGHDWLLYENILFCHFIKRNILIHSLLEEMGQNHIIQYRCPVIVRSS